MTTDRWGVRAHLHDSPVTGTGTATVTVPARDPEPGGRDVRAFAGPFYRTKCWLISRHLQIFRLRTKSRGKECQRPNINANRELSPRSRDCLFLKRHIFEQTEAWSNERLRDLVQQEFASGDEEYPVLKFLWHGRTDGKNGGVLDPLELRLVHLFSWEG